MCLNTMSVYSLNSVSIFLICLITVLPVFRASFESTKFAYSNDMSFAIYDACVCIWK
ncbi:hypothetical protein HanPSC8_Chr14g0614571 [Helianthus annuus]|nr:hypothetical protein HanPSC8_Chr14g0614571 [Helianthus annuus]